MQGMEASNRKLGVCYMSSANEAEYGKFDNEIKLPTVSRMVCAFNMRFNIEYDRIASRCLLSSYDIASIKIPGFVEVRPSYGAFPAPRSTSPANTTNTVMGRSAHTFTYMLGVCLSKRLLS
jgi:hypothetical protein